MPDFWKNSYSGGEFAEGNVRKFIQDATIAETLRLIRESHSSIIGPCAPTDLLDTDADGHAYDANIDDIRRQRGYQLSIESISHIQSARPGDQLPLQITWLNRGVAPFYYAWPVEFSLLGQDGVPAFTALGKSDVRT